MDHPRTFKLTQEHVNLLRSMMIDWDESMGGAPMVDPLDPYGGGPGPGAVLQAAGVCTPVVNSSDREGRHVASYRDSDALVAQRLHAGTATALQIVLSTASFEPGTYRRLDNRGRRWERVSGIR